MTIRSSILLTNDDGIDAPGLEALVAAASGLDGNPVVVAPSQCHSGGGHRVTTHGPIAVRDVGPGRYSIAGTTADCTRLGLASIVPGADLVLSGINAGGNLGVDVHHSGTVAAAREAALHGRRAVAASQYRGRSPAIDWDRAAAWLVRALERIRQEPCGPGEFWNVNFPDLPADVPWSEPRLIVCPVDPSPFARLFRESPEGWHWSSEYRDRPRMSGHDIDVCFGGDIALSRCRVI